jgi:DNA-binding phage protein
VAHRAKDWDEDMFEDLADPEFTSELVMGMVESGMSLQEAVLDVVHGIGVKEFAARVGTSSPNVVRTFRSKSNPTLGTLERMLKPLGLRVGVAYCDGKRRRWRNEWGV